MVAPLLSLLRLVLLSIRDLAPIILVIAFFQVVVLKAPLPDLSSILTGLALVMVGLTLFVQGLELGLFPLGEAMADALARRGSVSILLAFAFALGFGTTAAEPALVAVASEAAEARPRRRLGEAPERAGLERCDREGSPGLRRRGRRWPAPAASAAALSRALRRGAGARGGARGLTPPGVAETCAGVIQRRFLVNGCEHCREK